MEPRITLKDGVKFAFIDLDTLKFFEALLTCAEVMGRDFTITSAANGTHKATSYHPKGYAWDIRLNDVAPGLREQLRDAMVDQLPAYFDVVLEEYAEDIGRDHLHVEADQRKKESL